MWNNWTKNDAWARLTNYVVGLGVGLIIAAAIAGNHKGATGLLIIIGCVLVVVPLVAYYARGSRK